MISASSSPPGFRIRAAAQRGDPLVAFHQVVERAHQQRDVDARVGQRQVAGLRQRDPEARLGRGAPGSHRHVPRHRVDQDDVVAAARQVAGVRAGTAADVGHAGLTRQEPIETSQVRSRTRSPSPACHNRWSSSTRS